MSSVTSTKMRRLKLSQSLKALLMIGSLSTCIYACDDEGKSDDDAGETASGVMMAGEAVAGESIAGEMVAGETSAGETSAGETSAGEAVAGEMTAGEMMAGETAGEMMAGETAGEMMAGETAGEMMAGETAAGEMNSMSDYAPETAMNALSEDGQRAFCDAFVARDQAAAESTSAADQIKFKETSCLLAGLFGGASDEMGCEADRQVCLMEFESTMTTVDSCLDDFNDAFLNCTATVAEAESCEIATRELLLSSILALPISPYSCANVGDPSLFLLATGIPSEPAAECTLDSIAMCQ